MPGMPVIPTSPETEVLVQGWGTDPGVIDRQTPVGGDGGNADFRYQATGIYLESQGKKLRLLHG